MSGPGDAEDFLRRWSRRKQAARAPVRETEETHREADAGHGPSPVAVADVAAVPAFDPASLPPLESIAAASDIRAFLTLGVPEEISRAALRRAWVTDPAIRDFVGLAENQWDFTNPDGVPGFGALDLTPELRRMVADLFRSAPAETESTPAEVVKAIESSEEAISTLTPIRSDKTSEMPARAVAHASSPSEAPAPAAAGPDPVGLADGGADAALHPSAGPTNGLPTSSRRRHGRAVPK
jgi:hypothetical protein